MVLKLFMQTIFGLAADSGRSSVGVVGFSGARGFVGGFAKRYDVRRWRVRGRVGGWFVHCCWDLRVVEIVGESRS